MDYKKLDELNRLHKSGALTDEEFQAEKEKIMNEDSIPASSATQLPFGISEDVYLALMSFLILFPYFGWLIPIIFWIMGRKVSKAVDQQGKYILNWYISFMLYGIVLFLIFMVTVVQGVAYDAHSVLSMDNKLFPFFIHIFGNPLTDSIIGFGGFAIALSVIIGIILFLFPIIGGIKGLQGKTWKYPLSIPFLK